MADKKTDERLVDIGERKIESQGNIWVAMIKRVAAVLAICLAIFQLGTAGVGALPALQQRTIHICAVCIIVFLLYPLKKKDWGLLRIIDLVLISATVYVGVHLYFHADQFALMALKLNLKDTIVGILGLIIIFEATRRVMGWIMPTVAGIFLLYGIFGQYMPGLIAHRGYSLERIAYQMWFTTEGVLGTPLGVSATFVAVFVIFAAFLRESGAGDFFINVAFGAFGRFRGGPAKAAVVASSLFGTFSGSAIANVVGTGTFTIPLMKKTGYRPQFAAAVESVSSTGGQLVPPVMGAAAFLMTEFIDMSYGQIMLAAILPAFLYYLAVFVMVDLEAGANNIVGLPRGELPSVKMEFLKNWIMTMPILVLIGLLAYSGTSPSKAGFWATITVVIVGLINRNSSFKPKDILKCLEAGGKAVIEVATACSLAGVIIGIITLTGLGMKLSNVLITIAGGNSIILLVLTAIACIILGMGVPTTACYLVVAMLVAPALIQMGIVPVAAHLFVFYYGVLAMITPPVALAAYAGAGIAGSDPFKTGFTACKLGILAFIIPFMFVLGPSLLLEGTAPEIIQSIVTAIAGTLVISLGINGWWRKPLHMVTRVLFLAAGLCLTDAGSMTDIIAIILVVAAFVSMKFLKGKDRDSSDIMHI